MDFKLTKEKEKELERVQKDLKNTLIILKLEHLSWKRTKLWKKIALKSFKYAKSKDMFQTYKLCPSTDADTVDNWMNEEIPWYEIHHNEHLLGTDWALLSTNRWNKPEQLVFQQ